MNQINTLNYSKPFNVLLPSLIVKAKSITSNDISDFIVKYPAYHLPFSSHTVFVDLPQTHSASSVLGPLYSFFPLPERLFRHLQDLLTPLFPVLDQILPSRRVQFWPPQLKLHPTVLASAAHILKLHPTNASFRILLTSTAHTSFWYMLLCTIIVQLKDLDEHFSWSTHYTNICWTELFKCKAKWS